MGARRAEIIHTQTHSNAIQDTRHKTHEYEGICITLPHFSLNSTHTGIHVKSTRTFVVRLYFDVSLFENPPSLSTLIHSLTRCTCLFVNLFVCLCARNVQVRVSIHCYSCIHSYMAAFVMYSIICVSQPLTLSHSL